MTEDFRIRVFLTVVSEGGFKKAADVLGISQSAVSQRIADLEKDLGVKLFSRNRLVGDSPVNDSPQKGRPYISLSEAGALFRPYAEKIMASYAETSSLFTPYKSSKPIRIATTSFVSASILPEVLKTLSAATGATFITDIFPDETDFEALIGPTHDSRPTGQKAIGRHSGTSDDLFSPYKDAEVIAVWTSFETGQSSRGLIVHAKASSPLADTPLYQSLLHFLGL